MVSVCAFFSSVSVRIQFCASFCANLWDVVDFWTLWILWILCEFISVGFLSDSDVFSLLGFILPDFLALILSANDNFGEL